MACFDCIYKASNIRLVHDPSFFYQAELAGLRTRTRSWLRAQFPVSTRLVFGQLLIAFRHLPVSHNAQCLPQAPNRPSRSPPRLPRKLKRSTFLSSNGITQTGGLPTRTSTISLLFFPYRIGGVTSLPRSFVSTAFPYQPSALPVFSNTIPLRCVPRRPGRYRA